MLIDFWTYTCINCIRTLPHLVAWDKAYRDKGLTIVGVHSPEFSFEKKASNVERAIKQNGIEYPVAQDNELATWNAWSNQYWPAKYLIDANGHVRYAHFGEGDYDKTEAAIRALLVEAGRDGRAPTPSPIETYDPSAAGDARDLPRRRAGGALPARRPAVRHRDLHAVRRRAAREPLHARRRAGRSTTSPPPRARARRCAANVTGKDVYLVLSGPGTVDVTVDGKPEQTVKVTTQKLYHLLSRPEAGRRTTCSCASRPASRATLHVRADPNGCRRGVQMGRAADDGSAARGGAWCP